MLSITQQHEYGCGAACVAFILGINYLKAVDLLGVKSAQSTGFGCQKLCGALSSSGQKYRFKKYKPELSCILNYEYSIVFIKRSTIYPHGHYLCHYNGQWMDPWLNLHYCKDVSYAESGFRTELPGEPEFVLFKSA